jgi:protein phosphatase
MIIYGWSDLGRRHLTNDDSIFPAGHWPAPYPFTAGGVAHRGYLLAVADGVTMAALGAHASRQAIETLVHTYYDPPAALDSVEIALLTAALAANKAAWDLTAAEENDDLAATTLVAAVIRDGVVQVIHAGDSRAYLVTPDQVVYLTSDHSVVQDLIDAGEISPEEALDHPENGVLTRALGVASHVRFDLSAPVALGVYDSLVLCSDGLSTLVHEDEIGQVVRSAAPARAVHRLIDLANRRGGYDNISVVIASPAERKSWWRRVLG